MKVILSSRSTTLRGSESQYDIALIGVDVEIGSRLDSWVDPPLGLIKRVYPAPIPAKAEA